MAIKIHREGEAARTSRDGTAAAVLSDVTRRKAKKAQATADEAERQAEITSQNFWFENGTGTEAGAHVTEVPRKKWVDPDDPSYHSGSNLLLQSQSVKIRMAETILSELKANEMTLASNKAKVKYTEDSGILGIPSHRIVVCKTSDDSEIRNDAVLSSLDLSNFDANTTPMAFADVAHSTINGDKGADAGLYVWDGTGLGGFIYLGAGDQAATALGEGLWIEARGLYISDTSSPHGAALKFENGGIDIYRDAGDVSIDDDPIKDWVTDKGKEGSWYYEKWSSGKVEAWSDAISSGALSMSARDNLYRATGVEFAIANDIFDDTPTSAMVSIPYSSAYAVSVGVVCTSATKLTCQIWKSANNNDPVNLKFHVVYYPSTY